MTRALPVIRRETADDRIAELFEDHHGRLFRLARRLTSNRHDALDLVQETFLRVSRRPSAIPIGSAVRILINIQRDRWRRSIVRERHHAAQDSSQLINSPEPALVLRATIWRALDVLPPRRRAVLVLHELEELGPVAFTAEPRRTRVLCAVTRRRTTACGDPLRDQL